MAPTWEVVGGNVMVREGASKKAEETGSISKGATVEELEIVGTQMKYKLLNGNGAQEGWVSLAIDGEPLLKKADSQVADLGDSVEESDGKENVCLLFPGQGSQYVGMLKEMADNPAVKSMLQKSKDILGWDVLDLCLNGPEEKLEETKFCQPCLFIGGLAALEKLRAEQPEKADNPKYVGGLSLGEYTALCAAGVFTFEEGLKLVKLRGEAMHEAATSGGKQLMLSVVGLPTPKLQELCEESKEEEGGDATCSIANQLFPDGNSCGGTEKAIELLQAKADSAGAMKTTVLKTAGAFHTALMQPAQTKLNAALDEILPKMKPPNATIFMNATAEKISPGGSVDAIVANMKKQLTSPVKWEPTCQKLIREGCNEYYECGPMKQLKAMMKRIDQRVWKTTYNVDI